MALHNDQEVAAKVLDHIANKRTDKGDSVWREPVANYLSSVRFEAEMTTVLRCLPTPFCPSAALPEAGSYIAREAAGVPLLVVRGKDGLVRAFRNACRHRGAQVAQGAGCARAFRCHYHGWTYNLEGGLQHIPHRDGFPDVDLCRHGLVPVHVEEHFGLVIVTQQGEASALDSLKGLNRVLSPEQQYFAKQEIDVDANWKLMTETFLEGYHIKSTHRETFFPFGYDNLNVIETFGLNARIIFPFQRIERQAEVAPNERTLDGAVTDVYHLFPNVLLVFLSHHINLVILEPISVEKTRMLMYSLTNNALQGEEAVAKAKKDVAFVSDEGNAEDIAQASSIQKSLKSGANEFLTFGHYEALIGHFHRNMAELLGSVQK